MTMTVKTKAGALLNERIINDAPRHFDDFPVGIVSHQGDVTLVAIDKPSTETVRDNRQVAEGNTQGSRHVLDGGEIFDCRPEEVHRLILAANGCKIDLEYIGPVFRGGQLTHPEHGDQSFPSEQTIAVVYQRSQDAEERARRVRD